MGYELTSQIEVTCDRCGITDCYTCGTLAEGKAEARDDGWTIGSGGSYEAPGRKARATCRSCRQREGG